MTRPGIILTGLLLALAAVAYGVYLVLKIGDFTLIEATRIYLPWLLSAITIYTMWQAGNRHRFTWLVGLANQALWLIWIIVSSAWGLLPMNFALWFVYGRNHMKWAKERRLQTTEAHND